MARTPLEDLIRDVERAIGGLRSMGVRVNPSSRLAKLPQEITIGAREANPSTRFCHAIIDAKEVVLISRFSSGAIDAPHLSLLEKFCSDPHVPRDEVREEPGRDAQFELYLGARLCAGGTPAKFDEPDIIAPYGDIQVCIAAKRPRSIGAIIRRLRDAFKQVSRVQLHSPIGIVAMDVSRILNPEGAPRVTDEPSWRGENTDLPVEIVRAIVDEMRSRLPQAAPNLAGVLVRMTTVTANPRDHTIGESTHFHALSIKGKSPEAMQFVRSVITCGQASD